VPIDLVVYPNVHHGFYYPELQPGRAMLGRWLEYSEEQPPIRAGGCGSFSIAISTEGSVLLACR